VGASVALAGNAQASAATLRVCTAGPPTCQYSSIQRAVDAAPSGATIAIAAGTYNEDLTIPGTGAATSLRLRGAGFGTTIIDGAHRGTVVTIGSGISVAIIGAAITDGDALEQDGGVGDGGGIKNDGSLTLSHSAVSNNQANRGGGIWNDNGGTVKLHDSIVSDNAVLLGLDGGYGGGIYNLGTTTLNRSTVSGNDAAGQAAFDGGITNAGTMRLSKTTVSDNDASHGAGGIDNQSAGTMKLSKSAVTGNRTLDGAGGINNGGTMTLTESEVTDNSTDLIAGGISNSGTMKLFRSTVSGNTNYNDGGGITNAGTITLTNSEVTDNSAGFDGGGIYNSGTATLFGSIVTGNTAGRDGGGVYNSGGLVKLSNSTVTGNSPDDCSPAACRASHRRAWENGTLSHARPRRGR
jgi:hypothetical protein